MHSSLYFPRIPMGTGLRYFQSHYNVIGQRIFTPLALGSERYAPLANYGGSRAEALVLMSNHPC